MSTTFISSLSKQDIIDNTMPAIACFTVGMSVAWAVSKAAYWIFDHCNVEVAEKTLTRSVNALTLIAGTIASFAASRYLPYLGMAFGPILGKYSWASISLGILGAAIGQKQSRPDYQVASNPQLSSNISPNCAEEAERNNILPSSGQVVIYGYSHCCYSDLRYGFAKHKNVSPFFPAIADAENMSNKAIGRECKNYLVQTLLENYRRKIKNNPKEPQIPIIFCMDVIDNPYSLTAENILSRTKYGTFDDEDPYPVRQITTHKEIRRAFQLCYSKNLPEEFKKIAQDSFKFVKVEFEDLSTIGTIPGQGNTKYRKVNILVTKITKINAPWENPDWKNEWEKQKKTKPANTNGWRKRINDTVNGNNSNRQTNKKTTRQQRGK